MNMGGGYGGMGHMPGGNGEASRAQAAVSRMHQMQAVQVGPCPDFVHCQPACCTHLWWPLSAPAHLLVPRWRTAW